MIELGQKLATAKKIFRTKLILGTCAGVFLFAVVLPLAYFAQSISFRMVPQLAANNASVSVSDGFGWVLSNRAYLLGSQATMHFEAPGFISQAVDVDFRNDAKPLLIEMQEGPVNVVITTEPQLPQTRWYIDGVYATTAERFEQAMQPGTISIEVNNEFYQPQVLPIEVQTGNDITQHLTLLPTTGNLSINSEPEGALVMINGEEKGVTPIQISALPGGLHRMQVILEGYEHIEEEIAITNNMTAEMRRDYRLELNRTTVRINAAPAGGVLRVNGVATDATARLSLAIGTKYILQYEKPGYLRQTQEVLLKSDQQTANQQTEISFQLQNEIGEVAIRSTPPADLLINGKAMGVTPQTVHLQARPQKITLKRAGYRTVELSVMPTAATQLLIDEELETESAARLSQAAAFVTAAAKIKMKFFDPRRRSKNRFTMGAPPDEKFRRANEFQRQVNLTKPFYVSITEITEQQFAHYKPIQVAGKKHPVRNVSWLDAAGFANWMSAQDGLQPAYKLVNGKRYSFDSTADGYRLLSEAEWEWLARIAGRAEVSRFVWGNETTIPNNSGNFADQSAKGSVPKYIPRYNDGFAGVAPVASFTADVVGLYDMAGNVSEWVHDGYNLQPPKAGQVETNPFGGRYNDGQIDAQIDDLGNGRVIKGASFRSASTTRLRSSFRDGLLQARDDVGFRIARYLYGQE